MTRELVSDVRVTPGDAVPLLGLWRLAGPATLNGVPAAAGDFLTPGKDGRWQLGLPAGEPLRGAFPTGHVPRDSMRASLRALAGRLDGAPPLATWLATPPLPPDLRAELELRPLERHIEEHLPHLEEVVRAPHSRLQLDIERVHVSRARRVPAEALRRLAAHTEDWERLTLNAPRPRHILSEVRSEHLDTYENRVVARLIDGLREYLAERVRDVRKTLRTLESIEDYSEQAGATNHWLAHRVCSLWGEKYQLDSRSRDGDRALLRRLEHLLRRVQRLQDSALYRAIPRRSEVARTLRRTNVLTHDRHYRFVRLLWTLWEDDLVTREPSPDESHARFQQLCRDMQRFAALLVLRALDQLGYRPQISSVVPFGPGRSVTLALGESTLSLEWPDAGPLTLVAAGRRHQVVALPATLVGDGDMQAPARLLARLRPAAPLLLLHLELDDVPMPPELRSLDNDPRHRLVHDLSVIPVSPHTLTSVERVARWLRWTLDGAAIRAYPPTVPTLPAFWMKHGDAPWLRRDAKQGRVVRPLAKNDRHRQALLDEFQALRAKHDQLEADLQALNEGRKGRLDDKRDRSQMNETRTKLNQALSTTRTDLKAAESFVLALERAGHQFDALCRCPVCEETLPLNAFEARNDSTFVATCEACATSWGTIRCTSGHLVPFIEHPDAHRPPDVLLLDWIERRAGRDLLALPSENTHWLCPECPASISAAT